MSIAENAALRLATVRVSLSRRVPQPAHRAGAVTVLSEIDAVDVDVSPSQVAVSLAVAAIANESRFRSHAGD